MVIDTQNKRIIKILKMFTHNNNNQSVSSANIAALLGVSSKTIRNDIKECNTFLKKYGAVFLAEPSVGYVLKINDEKNSCPSKRANVLMNVLVGKNRILFLLNIMIVFLL